ncbi:hypothetical protein D3C72_1193350 [compost metagenome]
MVSVVSFSVSRKCFSMARFTSSVRPEVAPAGSVAITITLPWSSSGRKPPGRLRYSRPMPATMATYTAVKRSGLRRMRPSTPT